jgi:hypothetical protein
MYCVQCQKQLCYLFFSFFLALWRKWVIKTWLYVLLSVPQGSNSFLVRILSVPASPHLISLCKPAIPFLALRHSSDSSVAGLWQDDIEQFSLYQKNIWCFPKSSQYLTMKFNTQLQKSYFLFGYSCLLERSTVMLRDKLRTSIEIPK